MEKNRLNLATGHDTHVMCISVANEYALIVEKVTLKK